MTDLLTRAAHGDLEAQRVMAAQALNVLVAERVQPEEGFPTAELWARLAAGHGRAEDLRNLSTMLLARSGFVERADEHLADMLAAEALSLLDRAADLGDDEAARCLANVGPALRPAAFVLVAQFADCKAREPA